MVDDGLDDDGQVIDWTSVLPASLSLLLDAMRLAEFSNSASQEKRDYKEKFVCGAKTAGF